MVRVGWSGVDAYDDDGPFGAGAAGRSAAGGVPDDAEGGPVTRNLDPCARCGEVMCDCTPRLAEGDMFPTFNQYVRGGCARSIHCFLEADHKGACRDAAFMADGTVLDPMWLRLVRRDGADIILGRCPLCGTWGDLDDDQLHGRVSTHHDTPECGYHDTKNWMADHAV